MNLVSIVEDYSLKFCHSLFLLKILVKWMSKQEIHHNEFNESTTFV